MLTGRSLPVGNVRVCRRKDPFNVAKTSEIIRLSGRAHPGPPGRKVEDRNSVPFENATYALQPVPAPVARVE